ncbi:MAG: cyclopropane fatty acyl phospholipid synthase [Chlamydiota bacterium]
MSTNSMVINFLESAGISIDGNNPHDIKVHDSRLYKRLQTHGSLGAGEGYMEGWWDCDQLDELFYRICRNRLDGSFNKKWMIIGKSIMNTVVNLQTRFRSLRVAEEHYNLGNDLYERMLGPTMAYTCGYWKDAKNLDEAQNNKFDLICRKVGMKPGDRILELGCGWGTLAKYAAENYGVEVIAANISSEQVNYAKKNCQGLPIEFFLCDYRDDHIYNPSGEVFDHVVSVGLCEHVGAKNYRTFIEVARRNMKEDGLFLLHTIGRNNTSYYVDPWISKYIFPNSLLPSIKLLSDAAEDQFIIEDLHNIGADYDKTLMEWHKNFNSHWESLSDQYDEKFFRLWNYYLLSCAGGFRARSMQLWQIVLSPNGVAGGYNTVR